MNFKEQIVELLPSLRAYARSLCGDPVRADDLVQETVLKAWKNRQQFAPGTNLKAWAHAILRNHYFSEWRKRKFECQDVDGALSARLEVAPGQIDRLRFKEFRHHLMALPEAQREALILVGANGFTYEEVAAICGCAVGTVKSRVNRARDRLASLVEGESQATGRDNSSYATISSNAGMSD